MNRRKNKNMCYMISNIYLLILFIDNLDENDPIVEKIIKILEKINDLDVDADQKLMEWSKKKFEKKVMEIL